MLFSEALYRTGKIINENNLPALRYRFQKPRLTHSLLAQSKGNALKTPGSMLIVFTISQKDLR